MNDIIQIVYEMTNGEVRTGTYLNESLMIYFSNNFKQKVENVVKAFVEDHDGCHVKRIMDMGTVM